MSYTDNPNTSPNSMGNGFGDPTQHLRTTLQFNLLSQFSTGNPIIDGMIQAIIWSIIGSIVMNIQNIFRISFFKYYFDKLIRGIKYIFYKYVRKKEEVINKEVIVDYITDKKKINRLYEALDWYISTRLQVDYIKETPLNLSFEEDPENCTTNNVDELNLNKRITQNKYKSFKYKEQKIYYLLNKNLITVYADQERKRENYSIILNTKIKADCETDILDEFCKYCLSEYIKHIRPDKWTQKIYTNDKTGKWTPQDSNNKRKIDTVILKNNDLDDIKDDIEDFVESKEWYHDRDVPYTRGYLFYGNPGTGKTSLLKGISTFTKRHMHYLILNNVQNDEQLLQLLNGIKYEETILIIEDIDCMTDIIQDRKKKQDDGIGKDDIQKIIKEEIGKIKNDNRINNFNESHNDNSDLTLSGLLNAIDGIFNNDGRIMVMTTNHPEVLDEALIRPGRIDRKILFDNCNREQIINIYKMMFDNLDDDNLYKLNEIEEGKYSPAEITSLFLRFKNKPKEALNNLHLIEKDPLVGKKKLFNKIDSEKTGTNNGPIGYNSIDSLITSHGAL